MAAGSGDAANLAAGSDDDVAGLTISPSGVPASPHPASSNPAAMATSKSQVESCPLARTDPALAWASREQRGEGGRCRMRRVEAANPSLTVGALSLAPEFSATFGANFMLQVRLNNVAPRSLRITATPRVRLECAPQVIARAAQHPFRLAPVNLKLGHQDRRSDVVA